jgi:8-oxo-dGTP diphosphatase
LGIDGKIISFIGAVESKWEYNEKLHSEINLIFHFNSNDLSTDKELVSQEKHLEFLWIHKDECERYNLLPKPMRKIVSKIPIIDSAFWGSDYKNV